MSEKVAFLKIGRLFSIDALSPGKTYYHRGLQLQRDWRNSHDDDPVLVDHDKAQQVGAVHELFEHRDLDGPWLLARVTITNPPAWLQRGTPASWRYQPLSWQSTQGVERVLSGLVSEVSILSPGTTPAEPDAQVISLRRADLDPDELREAWLEERARYRQLVALGQHKRSSPPLSWEQFANIPTSPPDSEHTRKRSTPDVEAPGHLGDRGQARVYRPAVGQIIGIR